MKKYLVLLLFAFVTSMTFAQSDYQDVVYLKNGSIIRGLIIEQIPNKSIKLETGDRNVLVYQMDEIEKLTKEQIKEKTGNSGTISGLNKGYKGIVEVGYDINIGNNEMNRAKLNIINGYQINPYFSIGIGTGLRYFHQQEAALIPFFLDLRANFLNERLSPYFALGIGNSYDATNNFERVGRIIDPSAGISFKIFNRSAMNFGIGYEMQILNFNVTYDDTSSYSSNAISFNVGISF